MGDLPRGPIVHAEVWDVEAAHWIGVADTPRSKLALANQNTDLLIHGELRRCDVCECSGLFPGS